MISQEIIIWDGISLLKVFPGSGTPPEHAAERARFESVVDSIEMTNPVMVELGAYWALWSIVFGKKTTNAKLIVVEGNLEKLNVGLRNLQLNDLLAIAYYNTIVAADTVGDCGFKSDVVDITLDEIFANNGIESIDLLHMDIQGAEFGIYEEVCDKLRSGLIKNVIMATHFKDQHALMLAEFMKLQLHISEFPPNKTDGEIIITQSPIIA